MSEHRKYKKPPLVEALCELYFTGSKWDDTVLGRFYERVKLDGFSRRETVDGRAVPTEGAGEDVAARTRRAEPRMRFLSQQQDRVLQVGRDVIVVNQLRPYPHFEHWEPIIRRAARTYEDIADPRGIAQIGLRYINLVPIAGPKVALQEYFTVGPQIPGAWQDEHGSFLVRVEKRMANGLRMVMTFGSAPSEAPGKSAFLLDLYAVVEPDTLLRAESLLAALAMAHDSIEEVFEGSITATLRRTFEPETPS